MLEYYLTICQRVHQVDPNKFCYFETHSGDGVASFPDGSEQNGSALIAASNSLRFRCVLAEAVRGDELDRNLRTKLGSIDHVMVIRGDSNVRINDILVEVPRFYHSLGFLDPTHPGELNWQTVVAIAHHTYQYKAGGDFRLPEMLVNFPIGRIKQNAGWLEKPDSQHRQTALANNDSFFGNEEWRQIWQQDEDLASFYTKRVLEFGYTQAYWVLVSEIEYNVPLYYLMLFIRQRKAQEVLPGMAKNLDRWRREDFIRDVYKIHDLKKWMK